VRTTDSKFEKAPASFSNNATSLAPAQQESAHDQHTNSASESRAYLHKDKHCNFPLLEPVGLGLQDTATMFHAGFNGLHCIFVAQGL
jgi:hypothetical protein